MSDAKSIQNADAIRDEWIDEERWHIENAKTDLTQFMRPVPLGSKVAPVDLFDIDGNPMLLADLWQRQPLILVTGSLSCPPSRLFNPTLNALADEYADRCGVAILYVIDAHPSGDVCPYTGTDWLTRDNEEAGLLVAQPADVTERLALARRYINDLGLTVTVVVDNMANSGWEALGRSPNTALLIDTDGCCRYWQDWLRPEELRQQLGELISGAEETGT